MGILRKCVEENECEVTLYAFEGCGACSNMEDKLDQLNIPYEKKQITLHVMNKTGINSVPQVIIETPNRKIITQDPDEIEELFG